jgi:hypothetical protein
VVTYDDNINGAYLYLIDAADLTDDLTIGKRYRMTLDAKYASGSAGSYIRVVSSDAFTAAALTTSTISYEIEFTVLAANPFLNVYNMGASNVVTIDNLSLVPIGAVAEYDGSGVGKLRWDDKSGNELHGTVGDGAGGATAPTVENAPADADSGLTYEEGTWTASFTAATGTITKNPSYDLCRYTKVGRLVNVAGRLNVSSVSTPSGEWRITGLPETINNNTDGELSGTVAASIWIESLGSAVNACQAYGITGTTDIMIKEFNGTTDATMADKVQAGTNVFFSCTYTV